MGSLGVTLGGGSLWVIVAVVLGSLLGVIQQRALPHIGPQQEEEVLRGNVHVAGPLPLSGPCLGPWAWAPALPAWAPARQLGPLAWAWAPAWAWGPWPGLPAWAPAYAWALALPEFRPHALPDWACHCLGPAWAPGLGHLPCLPGPLLGPWAWTWAPAWAWAPGLPPLPGLLPTPWPLPCLGPFSALPQATRAQAPGRPKQAQAWAQTGAQA